MKKAMFGTCLAVGVVFGGWLMSAGAATVAGGYRRDVLQSDTIGDQWHSYMYDGAYDSATGTVGVVYRDPDRQVYYYRTIGAWGASDAEQVTGEGVVNPVLLYDANSVPHLFVGKGCKLMHFQRGEDGWTGTTVMEISYDDFPQFSNSLGGGAIDADGAFHLIFAHYFTVYYVTNKAGSWPSQPEIVEVLPIDHDSEYGPFDDIRWLADIAVDSSGNAHASYATLYEVRYATNAPGSWQAEDVRANSSLDLWPGADPCIAVKPDGTPAIAATEMDHAETGSVTRAKLVYWERTGPGQWPDSTVADNADGYTGNDGDHFTGVNPDLVFDAQGKAHIAFGDHGSSHNGNGWNFTKDGQIRLAVANGSGWDLTTIYRQSFVNEELTSVWLGVNPTSGAAQCFGVEVVRTGDVYEYTSDSTYNFLYVGADASAPTLSAPVGTVGTTRPVFRWSTAAGATWYQLAIKQVDGWYWTKWVQTTTWQPTDWSFTAGNYKWSVQSWSEEGTGAWSQEVTFTVEANPPEATSLVAPQGTTADATPAFSWSAVSSATWYKLTIAKQEAWTWSTWLQEASWTPTEWYLSNGTYDWYVTTWSENGYGVPAEGKTFTVDIPVSEKATLLIPDGEAGSIRPTFQWSAVSGAAWYKLFILQVNGWSWHTWVQDTSWAPTTWSMDPGDYKWWVQTWNSSGYGLWSDAKSFTVGHLGPAAPVQVSPADVQPTPSPEFEWGASDGATWYHLWIQQVDGWSWGTWVQGTTWEASGWTFDNGDYNWWIQAYGETGYGPWSESMAFKVIGPPPPPGR